MDGASQTEILAGALVEVVELPPRLAWIMASHQGRFLPGIVLGPGAEQTWRVRLAPLRPGAKSYIVAVGKDQLRALPPPPPATPFDEQRRFILPTVSVTV